MFLFERSALGNSFNFCDDQVRPESHPRFLVVIFGGIIGYAGLADPRGSSQYPALMDRAASHGARTLNQRPQRAICMLRKAVPSDLLALKSVRSSVVENVLGDSTRVTDDDYNWFVANPGVAVWEENGDVVGFSAADPRNGNIWALFVAPGFERNGIGSILLAEACACLKSAGIGRAWLTTDPNTRAEKFYRAAGWEHVGEKDRELLFERSL
ncbi:GNAT family N-acetyltransferase [Rhizobium leguminosarum]|uniref:GNAT family N-acetyltransferase n=1 Tax=Rhizobium leguminosarum TaxID=384 RepID=UPI001FEDAC54|nr:GNAT family N-acetyltransferase [Rhizobium leguminosarum]